MSVLESFFNEVEDLQVCDFINIAKVLRTPPIAASTGAL